jgi:broad specificity phosphatase PhoE
MYLNLFTFFTQRLRNEALDGTFEIGTLKRRMSVKSTYFAMLRHGHAENNAAEERFNELGDRRAYDAAIKIASSLHRLTSQGEQQVRAAGDWMRKRGMVFARHVVSGYVRAMQSAHMLEIPDAAWEVDDRLSEKDSGILNTLTPSRVDAHFAAKGNTRHIQDRYRYRPEGGESFLDLERRVRPVIESGVVPTLYVCHGHVIRVTDRVIMECVPSWEFGDFIETRGSIANGSLTEFRRDSIESDQWHRRVSVPWRGIEGVWAPVTRVRKTNDELGALIERALQGIALVEAA